MEITNGGNQASTQTRESSLPMGEIVVVREPTINPIAYSSDGKQASSPASFREIDQNPTPDLCLQTFSDYLKVAIILICVYLGVGAICFYLVRHQFSGEKTNSVLDAFYFTVILMTSVGYGELTPTSTLSRLLATLFAMVGMLLTGAMLSLVAQMFLAAQHDMVEALLVTSKTEEKVESNMMIKKCLVKVLAVWLVVFMTIGIVVLVTLENLDFIEAFYCINATLISVGSDKCFSTKGGRVFALFWILQGMGLISYILFTFTELYIQKRQSSLVKKILERTMSRADLDAADLDGDGVLVLAEYILYMLNEMEKLTRQDMEPIIEEYQRLEVNKRGLVTNDAQWTAIASDGGNQAPRPSFRRIPIPSSNREKRIAEYFPWIQTSYLWEIIIILSIYLGAGTTCFYLVRHHISGAKTNDVLDSLFFTLVITTSVGYGDLSPNSVLAILLSSLFSVIGMFLVVLVLSMGAAFLVKQQLHKIGPKTTAVLRKHKETNKVTNKIIMIVILFLLHMVVGTIILVFVEEDLNFIRAFECITVTITSASSHKCFSTKGGRVFALFWILLGTIYKGHALFTVTELYTQRTQRRFEKRKITTTHADLEAVDLDGDGVIVPAEYILHKLREKGKFCEEDVAPIIEKFQRLNIDNTSLL